MASYRTLATFIAILTFIPFQAALARGPAKKLSVKKITFPVYEARWSGNQAEYNSMKKDRAIVRIRVKAECRKTPRWKISNLSYRVHDHGFERKIIDRGAPRTFNGYVDISVDSNQIFGLPDAAKARRACAGHHRAFVDRTHHGYARFFDEQRKYAHGNVPIIVRLTCKRKKRSARKTTTANVQVYVKCVR